MAQYCRYCSWLCVGDVAYCGKLKKTMKEKQAKHTNHCKWYDLNTIDAFSDYMYKPRNKKENKTDQQKLF